MWRKECTRSIQAKGILNHLEVLPQLVEEDER